MDRESKRVKALEEYHTKKNRSTDLSSTMDGPALESGLQAFDMGPAKKGAQKKVPARFARLNQQKDEEVKEKEVAAKKEKVVEQVDLSTRLPTDIYTEIFTAMTKQLELGKLGDACTSLKAIKTKLTDKTQYCSTACVNLGLEHRIYQNTFAYRQGEDNEETGHPYKKVHKFVNLTVSEANPTLWSTSEQVSMRELIKAKKMSKAVEENDFKAVTDVAGVRHLANVQAIVYNYFSTLQTFPMYVHPENAKDAAEFVRMSLELGGLPLVDPVYEDGHVLPSVQTPCNLLLWLIKANNFSQRENILHLLAGKESLEDYEKELLTNFLADGSLQRINLWQKNYMACEPLAVAFQNRNLDFVKVVSELDASLDVPWSVFFNLGSYQFDRILVEQFTPPNQTEYAKMRQQIEQKSLPRFQHLTQLLIALRQNLEMRISCGHEDPAHLLNQIKDMNQKTFNALNGHHGCDQMEDILSTMAKLNGVSLQTLQTNFIRGKPCFERELSSIQALEEGLSDIDKVMLHSFNSLQLKSGYLIQQLCISATAEEVSDFTANVCPGLSHQMIQQIVPLLKIDEQLDSVQTDHFPIRFPFEPESDFTYCYPLKLAMLYNPENQTLDELLLSRMDYTKCEPFLLEIICLIGLSMGTENDHFKTIFAKNPWLFGDAPPLFQHVKSLNRKRTPSKALQFYPLEGYIKMVVTLGKILIRNHEIALFEQFFFSQNCMYMDDYIVSTLLQESVTYCVPECCVPIFALCSAEFNIKMLDDFDKKQIDYQSNKSNKTITEAQLQDSLLIQKLIIENRSVNLVKFLQICHQDLADKVIDLMLTRRTYSMHVRGLLATGYSYEKRDQEASTNESMALTEQIYNACSVEVVARFIESEWARKKESSDQAVKTTFLHTLLYIFANTSNQHKMQKILQKNHFKNFQKKTADQALQLFKDACNYKDQLQLLQRSVKESDVANEIAGRLGIETEEYVKICQAALDDYESAVLPHMSQQYHFSEIASASSGAMKVSDRGAASRVTQTKIKAVLQSTPTREGVLKEVVEWQKFDKVKHIASQIIASGLSTPEMIELLHLMVLDRCPQDRYGDYNGSKDRDDCYRNCVPDVEDFYQQPQGEEKMSHEKLQYSLIDRIVEKTKQIKFSRSYKFLMIQPLVIQLMSAAADNIFPFAETIIEGEKGLGPDDIPLAYYADAELGHPRRLMTAWSVLFNQLQLQTLYPGNVEQKNFHVGSEYSIRHGYIEETNFRSFYIAKLDSFTAELAAILLDHDERYRQFMTLMIIKQENEENCDKRNLSSIISLHISPLVDNVREHTEEPIQVDPSLALFKRMPAVFKQLNRIEPYSMEYFITYAFGELLKPFLPYADINLLSEFLEGEGTSNVFTAIGLKELNIILKRSAVTKQVKLLAIKRYIEVPSESRGCADEIHHINLVSYTNFFSDEYQRTQTLVGEITGDASILLHNLTKSTQLYSDFAPGELPQSMEDGCSDYRLIYVLLQTPPKEAAQEASYLTWLNFALEKVGKVDDLLRLCPRLFSWSSRALSKGSLKGFNTFLDWFQRVQPEHKSLLEVEAESQGNKNKLLVDLISEGRFEIVAMIKQMAEGTPLWEELKVIRTKVGTDRVIELGPGGYWDSDSDGDPNEERTPFDPEAFRAEAAEHSEPKVKLDPIQLMTLPCFSALSACRFDLCMSLIPDNKSKVLEPLITAVERQMLGSKLGINSVSTIIVKDPVQLQKLKDFEAEVARFQGIQDLPLIKILRMVGNFDAELLRQSIRDEVRQKKARFVSKALCEDALQHIDITMAYIDLGLVDPAETIFGLLDKAQSKQDALNVLIPLLSRFNSPDDSQVEALVGQFREQLKVIGAEPQKSMLAEYLETELACLSSEKHSQPTLSEVLQLQKGNEKYDFHEGISQNVMMLLEKDTNFWDVKTTTDAKAEIITVNADSTVQIAGDSGTEKAHLQRQIFAVAQFWLPLMKSNNFNITSLNPTPSVKVTRYGQRQGCRAAEPTEAEKASNQKASKVAKARIFKIFWSLDLSTAEEMAEIGNLYAQLAVFDPLVYHLQKQNFFYWNAYSSTMSQEEISEKRQQTEFIGRFLIDCIQTGSEDLAMVQYIAQQALKIGFFEVVDDFDDFKEEAFVKENQVQAMKTIFATLMSHSPKIEASSMFLRALVTLRSFEKETSIPNGQSLQIDFEFSLNGQQLKYQLEMGSLKEGVASLETVNSILGQIKEIPDIQHADLFSRVFENDRVFQAGKATDQSFSAALESAITNKSFIAELQKRSIELAQTFIFDGFFNKIVKGFEDYAVQFAEVALDPAMDVTGLKTFLEEKMPNPEKADKTIESVFEAMAWPLVEEVITGDCAFEVFSHSKLIITRCTKEEILASSKEDFRKNVATFRASQKTGFCEGEITLALCFDESTGQILVNKNSFLPYLYVIVEQGSRRLMQSGWQDNTKTINKPIFRCDVLSLCEELLQTEGLVPNDTDFVSFIGQSGLLAALTEKQSSFATELEELATQITREVTDCAQQYVVRKTTKIAFTHSKLAAVLVKFKSIGEPNYPDQNIEFSYSDMNPEPYENYSEELAESRPDLIMLGLNHKQVREDQTNMFVEKGFTRRPKSIRSIVATILIHCRVRKAAAKRQDETFGEEEEKKE